MMRMARTILLLAAAWASAAMAAENQAEQTLVYPCRPAAGPVVIDGRLDPAEWAGAIEVSGFRVSGSEKLAPEQVVMRVMYDSQNLYICVKCLESEMKKVKAAVNEKDGPFWTDDAIEFFLDPKHDHETHWQFAATAGAAQYDSYNGDSLWNSDWKCAVQRDADSWTIEAAVPFADLKVPAPTPGALWGFNLCREREAGGALELYNWADVQRVFNKVGLFGHLRFVAADWRPTEASIAAAAQDAGGKESIVYAEDGYWRVKTGGAPEHLTYRALLRGHDQGATPFIEELRGVYQQNPKMTLREEFEQLEARHDQIKSVVAAEGPIGVEDWVKATLFLSGLREKVEAMCWRVRLVELNESF